MGSLKSVREFLPAAPACPVRVDERHHRFHVGQESGLVTDIPDGAPTRPRGRYVPAGAVLALCPLPLPPVALQ